MLKLFISVFLLFTVAGVGLKAFQPLEVDKNKESDALKTFKGRLYYNDQLFSGYIVERFPDQSIYKKLQYKNGLMQGISEEFAMSGRLRVKWNYHLGKKHGLQTGWYIEGPKKFNYHYKEGLLHGESIEWYINGNIYRQRHFDHGVEMASKVLYSTKEVHTNYVKRDEKIYGLKSSELCMDIQKDGEIR